MQEEKEKFIDLPADFNEKTYLQLNPDLVKEAVEPTAHYLKHGRFEGRKYKIEQLKELPKGFDPHVYLELNPDVAKAGVDAVRHYLDYGKLEGRQYKSDQSLLLTKCLAQYSTCPPSEQNAFDLFREAWTTQIKGVETCGNYDALMDIRFSWLLKELGSIQGYSILELGPLEGGHTYFLEHAGGNVLAIEGNYGAFLRCLIMKNYFQMRSKFMLGDFAQLDFGETRFDLIVACGVLYHMKDPVSLLQTLSQMTDCLFLWTHYHEPDLTLWHPGLLNQIHSGKWAVETPITQKMDDLTIRLVRQEYQEALDWSGFCGGSGHHSYWIYKEDILAILKKLGFLNIKINFDEVGFRNGPSFALIARK